MTQKLTQEERHRRLVAKTREMRAAQKLYFISRKPIQLMEAKRLENEVDALLAEELYYPTEEEEQ